MAAPLAKPPVGRYSFPVLGVATERVLEDGVQSGHRTALQKVKRYSSQHKVLTTLVGIILLLGVLEYLAPTLVSAKFTYTEMVEHRGELYPAVASDYLPFTLPANVTLNGWYGTFKLNPFGYRGTAPVTLEKPANTFRILVIGDSFTLGWGVTEEETFVGRMGAALVGRSPAIEVINAAFHAGYSPDAYYAYLRKEGIALKPDLIVMMVYPDNDVYEMSETRWTSIDEFNAPRSLYTLHIFADYKGRLINANHLPWNYSVPILRDDRYFITLTNALNNWLIPQDAIQGRLIGQPLSRDEGLSRFKLVTQATAQFCQSQNIQLAYVVLPLPGVKASDDRYDEPTRQLIVDQLKLPYLATHDLLTVDHRLPQNGHLTLEGNRIVADAILKFIAPYLPKSAGVEL